MTFEELTIYYKKEIEALMELLTSEVASNRELWLEQSMFIRSELCSDRYHLSGREVLKAENHARNQDDVSCSLDHLKAAIKSLEIRG